MSSADKKKSDKFIEYNRYNRSSQHRLSNSQELDRLALYGSRVFPEYLQSPYIYYEMLIQERIKPSHKVLDLCCGDGIHSISLAKTGADVTATDIAENSIELARNRAEILGLTNIRFSVGDAENLEFPDHHFDFITCVGSLSYLNLQTLLDNVQRLLKPDGKFIVLDSYNHNPIYRLNRFIHYLKGERTLSTLERMPNALTVNKIKERFHDVDVQYFGVFAFLGAFLSKVFPAGEIRRKLDFLDRRFTFLKSHSFKIVILGERTR
jgi:SAM-dependent methyltransferase